MPELIDPQTLQRMLKDSDYATMETTIEALLLRAVACADGKLNKEDLTSAVHPAFVEALTIASTLSQEFCEAVHDGVDGQLERIAHEMSAACKALQEAYASLRAVEKANQKSLNNRGELTDEALGSTSADEDVLTGL